MLYFTWAVDRCFNHDKNIYNIPDNCDIRGYFQTEKYFKKYKKDLITKEFKFKERNKERQFKKIKVLIKK